MVWRPVGTWSEQASVQTDSFLSETGVFRVRWESQSHGGYGYLAGLIETLPDCAYLYRYLIPLPCVKKFLGSVMGTEPMTEDTPNNVSREISSRA
jgi:hypothetical protein